jgi:class 3 adenylate cyclase
VRNLAANVEFLSAMTLSQRPANAALARTSRNISQRRSSPPDDPEAWHKILDPFFQILTDGVHSLECTINQLTGDGIMALFAAPKTTAKMATEKKVAGGGKRSCRRIGSSPA